jgi:hypothetical protein
VILRKTETNRSPSRTALIKAIHGQIAHLGATELVFELDETAHAHDSKVLSDLQTNILWDHRERNQEPLLWVSDAVAWCVNRGGDWERLVRPLIIETMDC